MKIYSMIGKLKELLRFCMKKKVGYANNTASIYGLANKAESFGVRILTGTKVTGFKRGSNSKAVTGVVTSKGTIDCEQIIVGVGPWIKGIWDKLELPKKFQSKMKKVKYTKITQCGYIGC
jgi:glycine/D-amino acid oxidase-like deaminating enzyme